MATALRRLTNQPPPSEAVIPGLLDGMLNVNRLAKKWLDRGRGPRAYNPGAHQPMNEAGGGMNAPGVWPLFSKGIRGSPRPSSRRKCWRWSSAGSAF